MLQRAYDTRLMQGRFPFAVLHIGISPEEIDVNVHPNKLEVRFRHEDRIMGPFVTQCRKALEQTEEDLTLDFNAPEIKKIVYVQNEMPSAAAKDDTMKRVADMAFSRRTKAASSLAHFRRKHLLLSMMLRLYMLCMIKNRLKRRTANTLVIGRPVRL